MLKASLWLALGIKRIDEAIYAMKLGMDERRNIYLIVKESINNAVKYSGCKTLSVVFQKRPSLDISICDDGCGFDPDAPTSRNGLANMKRRAQQFKAELHLRSEVGKGTTIRIKTTIT